MDILQNGIFLSATGKGTPGGQLRLDGSEIEPGVHLRWQIAQEPGFPKFGFDIYRRTENYRKFLRCGAFREADVVGVAWTPYNDEQFDAWIEISHSGAARVAKGCGSKIKLAASFRGEQEVRLDFSEPARYVRITFDQSTLANPLGEAYWKSSSGEVLMKRQRAQLEGEQRILRLFADRIDSVILQGTDMLICEICFVLVRDGYDLYWPQIPLNGGAPIYLPVTHPDWYSPHPHSPDDQAEAESRLPAGLPEEKFDAYAQGFADDLHTILYDLVGTEAQHLYRLKHSDLDSQATLDWPGLSLLHLLAVDPNLARILGLYWHDQPPLDDTFFDYRIIAHYGDTPFPGIKFDFSGLLPDRRLGVISRYQGITYTSPNPIDTVRTTWDGSEHTALLFTRDILAGPIGIDLPPGVISATLRFIADLPVVTKFLLDYKELFAQNSPAGELTVQYEEVDGITDILLLTFGEIRLVEMVLRINTGTLGDQIYDVYHLRTNSQSDVPVPVLEPPLLLASPTGLDENGGLMPDQSLVGLNWNRQEAGGDYLLSSAPVQFQVQRDDLDLDGETVLRTAILNEAAPALISELSTSDDPSGNAEQPLYADRAVPDGIYRYVVRGVDLFGVLSEWSQPEQIEVQDHQPPPPPQAVQAVYLDPQDPFLSQVDKDWALAEGPGLKLSWQWPGIFTLQAPDVIPPQAEYRVYAALGMLNRLAGSVTRVIPRGSLSGVVTDIHWPGAADALAGESIRINQDFFVVTGNTQGENCTIVVKNLTDPELSPAPGPCSLSFSRERNYWKDYTQTRSWPFRLHVEPVQEIPIVSASVIAVQDFDADSVVGDTGLVITRPGATRTVTLDQALQDPDSVLLPGVLLCDGIVYPAYGHTLGEALQIHIVPVPGPAQSGVLNEPPLNAACQYYPGRRYELRLPGLELEPGPGTAAGHIAMSCSDGRSYIIDDPIWSLPGRGGLGGRSGNESGLSPAITVQAVQRGLPTGVEGVPSAPPEPIFASPADYYGQARYTLTWQSVPGAAGYAVYRCSGAALFDQDRLQRQAQAGYYESGNIFADDPGFAAWLAEFDPSLTEAEMVANPENHLDAWHAWAARFYGGQTDEQVQQIANRRGNEAAFQRLNRESVNIASFADAFDGRGQGIYLYRVRVIDAAGNLSSWEDSLTFPPVHIFDVKPPATPVVTSVLGGERSVSITWRSNREPDLAEYRLWVANHPDELADVRRTPPSRVLAPTINAVVETHVEQDLAGSVNIHFRLATADLNGNQSSPTPILTARPVDTVIPSPPTWISAQWNTDHTAIELAWSLAETNHQVLVQRKSLLDGDIWFTVSGWLDPGETVYQDPNARVYDTFDYRLSVKTLGGNLNTEFIEINVPPVS